MFNAAADRMGETGENVRNLTLKVSVAHKRDKDQTIIPVYKDGKLVGYEKIKSEE